MNRFKKTVAATAIAVATIGLAGCSSMNQQDHSNCTIQSKERLIRDGSSGEKRVYTSCGSFVANDSIAGGFGSQDTFNRLEEGKVYNLRTGDFRVGFLSMFPNIIGVDGPIEGP
ncbi:hypothetical protein [Rhodococcoides fascians]|uniref:hypothetical protein n=1 Tax=Rhodococcoides fascians TaxID=1828 RepID=UPI00055BA402|nr:hypothetical protein [Rhodococcus fascians]